jgi:hypothetical protein
MRTDVYKRAVRYPNISVTSEFVSTIYEQHYALCMDMLNNKECTWEFSLWFCNGFSQYRSFSTILRQPIPYIFYHPHSWGDIVPFVAIFNEILQLYAYVYVVIWYVFIINTKDVKCSGRTLLREFIRLPRELGQNGRFPGQHLN